MDRSLQPRTSPFFAWALPLAALGCCAAIVLTVHFASALDHSALAGLTCENSRVGTGNHGPDDRQHPDAGRLVVTSVKDGGPADAAGIRVGDVIERVEGMEIHNNGDVGRALAPHKSRFIDLQVARPGKVLDARLPFDDDLGRKSL